MAFNSGGALNLVVMMVRVVISSEKKPALDPLLEKKNAHGVGG